MNGDIKWC